MFVILLIVYPILAKDDATLTKDVAMETGSTTRVDCQGLGRLTSDLEVHGSDRN